MVEWLDIGYGLVYILVFAIPKLQYCDWTISVAHISRKCPNGRFDSQKTEIVYKQYLYQIPSIGGQCHRLLVPQFKHCMKADLIPEPTVIYIQLTHSAE
jgi:hypothetical protein